MWTTRTTIALFLAYLCLAVAGHVGYLDRPHGGSDDMGWCFELIAGRNGVFGEEYRSAFRYGLHVVRAQALVGHYAPVRGLLWVLIHAAFGDERFILGVVIVGFLMHAATAALLAKALDRISGARIAALFAGAVFAAHPIHDLPLSGANEGMNIYGLFFSMLAILAFDDMRAGRRVSRRSAAAAGWFMFCALNSNAVFLAISPLLIGVWAIARQLFCDRIPVKRWLIDSLIRSLPIVLAVGATLALRVTMNGTIGSRFQETVDWKASKLGFLHAMARHFVFLDPGADVLAKGELWYEPTARFAANMGQYLAAATGIVVALFAVIRCGSPRGEASSAGTAAGRPWVLILVGAAFFAATSGVYYAVRGAVWHHRYHDVGVIGFAPLLAGIVATIVGRVRPRIVATSLIGLCLLGLLVFYARAGIAAQNANREAGEIVRLTSTTMADAILAEPEIDVFFCLDLPMGIGRAGLVFRRDDPLVYGARIVNMLRTRDFSKATAALPKAGHEDTFLDEWKKLERLELIQRRIGVFAFDREHFTMRRVLAVRNPLAEFRDVVLFPVTSSDGHSSVATIPQATLDAVDRPWREEPVTPISLLRSAENDPEVAAAAMTRIKRLDPGLEKALVAVVTDPFSPNSDAARRTLLRLWASRAAKKIDELGTSKDSDAVFAAYRFATEEASDGSRAVDEKATERIRANPALTRFLVRYPGQFDAARVERDLSPSDREVARWLAVDVAPDQETIAGLTMLVRSQKIDRRDRFAALARLAAIDDRAGAAAIDPLIEEGFDRATALASIRCASATAPLTTRRALLAVLLRPDFPVSILSAAEERWSAIFSNETIAEIAPLHLALNRTLVGFRGDSPTVLDDLSGAIFDQGSNLVRVPEIADLRDLVARAVGGKLPGLSSVGFACRLSPVVTRPETRYVFASIKNESAEPIALGLGRNGFSIAVELVGKNLPGGRIESPPSPMSFTMIPPRSTRVLPIEVPLLRDVDSVRLTLRPPRSATSDGKVSEIELPEGR